MNTAIPPSCLREVLALKLSPATTASLLNAMERGLSSRLKLWPAWSACPTCRGRTWARCSVCGVWMRRNTKHLARVEQPVCSYQCNGVLRGEEWKAHAHKGRSGWTDASRASAKAKMTGPRNPAWKGGLTYRKRKGAYADQRIRYVRAPERFRPMARRDGYIMEHRLVVAEAMGRCLTRAESVHHVNHDATDNRRENLMLFRTNREHKLFEHHGAPEPIWCGLCGTTIGARSGACECRPARS